MKAQRRAATRAAQDRRAELVEAAEKARAHAHAPYSGYAVGAALRARSGRIYTGCNVENSSYGLSLCAERVAVGKAISAGEKAFDAIAVVTPSTPPGAPCGACRQVLSEFARDLEVILASTEGEQELTSLAVLFPRAFDKSYL
jgi:cytidine deaminase